MGVVELVVRINQRLPCVGGALCGARDAVAFEKAPQNLITATNDYDKSKYKKYNLQRRIYELKRLQGR